MNQYGSAGAASRSSWPSLLVLAAILVAVPFVLVLVYRKVLANRLEDES